MSFEMGFFDRSDWYTAAEAARRLQISAPSVYQLGYTDKLVSCRVDGCRYFLKESVEKRRSEQLIRFGYDADGY